MKYYWIYIFLCVVYSIKVDAHSNPEALKENRIRALELEMLAGLSSNDSLATQYIIKAKDIYKEDADYASAIKILKNMNESSLKNQELIDFKYELALLNYLNGDFGNAELPFIELLAFNDSATIIRELPLFVLINNELHKWEESRKIIGYLQRQGKIRVEKAAVLNALLGVKRNPKLKNPEKAKKMNTILPGLGYLYAGDIKEGIINTGFQVLTLGLTVYSVYAKYYITAALFSSTLFAKFYTGGVERSAFVTEKRNYLKCKKYNEQIKQVFLSEVTVR